jgi:hypothetical protein
MTATKTLSEMTTTELLLADQETGNALDSFGQIVDGPAGRYATALLRRRREIRAELNRRHEARQADEAFTDESAEFRRCGIV